MTEDNVALFFCTMQIFPFSFVFQEVMIFRKLLKNINGVSMLAFTWFFFLFVMLQRLKRKMLVWPAT